MGLEIFLAFVGGGALSAALVKLLDGFFNRGTVKADAAKALTDATTAFTAAVTDMNAKLQTEIRLLKEAIVSLTDVVDEMLPHIEGIDDIDRQRLRLVNNAAKLII